MLLPHRRFQAYSSLPRRRLPAYWKIATVSVQFHRCVAVQRRDLFQVVEISGPVLQRTPRHARYAIVAAPAANKVISCRPDLYIVKSGQPGAVSVPPSQR